MIYQSPKKSKKEMSEKIGISSTAIDKNIMALKNKNLIDRIGNGKAGKWIVINPK